MAVARSTPVAGVAPVAVAVVPVAPVLLIETSDCRSSGSRSTLVTEAVCCGSSCCRKWFHGSPGWLPGRSIPVAPGAAPVAVVASDASQWLLQWLSSFAAPEAVVGGSCRVQLQGRSRLLLLAAPVAVARSRALVAVGPVAPVLSIDSSNVVPVAPVAVV